MDRYVLYTDGSHSQEHDFSGWAFVLLKGSQKVCESSGRVRGNIGHAEREAIKQGLAAIPADCECLLICDIDIAHLKKFLPAMSGLKIKVITAKTGKDNHRWHRHVHHVAGIKARRWPQRDMLLKKFYEQNA